MGEMDQFSQSRFLPVEKNQNEMRSAEGKSQASLGSGFFHGWKTFGSYRVRLQVGKAGDFPKPFCGA